MSAGRNSPDWNRDPVSSDDRKLHTTSSLLRTWARARQGVKRAVEWFCAHPALTVSGLSALAIVSVLALRPFWSGNVLAKSPDLRSEAVFLALWLVPLYGFYQQMRMWQLKTRLTKREELFRLISENAADMIGLVDVNGKRLYNSPAYEKVLGYSAKELRSTSSFEQIHPDDRERVRAAAAEARLTGVGKRLEYRIRHKNGEWLVIESSASAIRNKNGEVEKLVIVNRDITERKRAEKKLEHNALHDGLTDLPNRTMFLKRLQRACDRGRRDSAYKFAVLFVDIDGFKVFNDTMGHGVGDELILDISQRLANCLRFEDTLSRVAGKRPGNPQEGDEVLARLGGDEFTILVGSIHDPSDAMRVAKRIQDALGEPFSIQGREVFTSASMGIALSTASHDRAEDLLRDADIAMFRAKMLGKSRCEFFDEEMHTQAVAQLQLETELRRAVESKEFLLHYQPIVLLETGELAGFEALVRWQHPVEGLQYPDRFLSVVEKTGLVVPLGKGILRQACQQAQSWKSLSVLHGNLMVTVNVSPRQFAYPDLISDVEAALQETGLDPRRLHLEVTESAAMADPERSKHLLARLKGLGISISIDDFGTGHSSLSRLRRFPVDVVKIDRSFITHMDSDQEASKIVHLIIDFAHTVNLKVVAEGVEVAAHRDQLKSLGCEYGQGYFFSRPVDLEGVERLLARSRAPLVAELATSAAGTQ
ncbi:MAG: putative bifunctional diguanylate cyclase/phosphodiesterase [Terriglobales bacterium]